MKRRMLAALSAIPCGVAIAIAAESGRAGAPVWGWWFYTVVLGAGCLFAAWGLATLVEMLRTAQRARRAEFERLRADNAELQAENAVLHDEVQSLDVDLVAAREGRIGGVA